jgi:hypothetical protein
MGAMLAGVVGETVVVDGAAVVAAVACFAGETAGLLSPLQPARTSIAVATGMASMVTGRFFIWLPPSSVSTSLSSATVWRSMRA